MRVACTAVALAALSLWGRPVSAQTALTLEDVLTRARTLAPEVVSAKLAIEEARGVLAGASIRQSSNPDFDLGVGSRDGLAGRSTDFQVGLALLLDPPGRRSARIASATAKVDQNLASSEVAVREALRAAAGAFYRAQHSSGQLRLLTSSEELALSIYQTADRRFRAGDIAALDLNLARTSLARARADRQLGEADLAAAVGSLRAVLGIGDPVVVAGELHVPSVPDIAMLRAAVEQRPELRALDSAVREAEAEVRLGRTFSTPGYGFGARYQREGDDHIVLGTFTVSLPVFAKGQDFRATGLARSNRIRAELDAARIRFNVALDAAVTTLEKRVAAVRVLESDALPSLDDNDTLTTRSFDVGQIGLPDVLLIRRETLETRRQYLSLVLEAVLARVDVDAAAGVLR